MVSRHNIIMHDRSAILEWRNLCVCVWVIPLLVHLGWAIMASLLCSFFLSEHLFIFMRFFFFSTD